MSVILGFTAMAIDVGMFFEDRRHLQNSADAMALAGVQDLPLDPATAVTKANAWAANNNIDPSEIKTVEVRTKDYPNDTLYVELDREFSWVFGRVLGKTVSNVGAAAAARTGSLSGGSDMMPWALLQGDSNCLDANGDAIFNATCYVKVGHDSIVNGWRGALDFDGNGGGSSEYKSNIIDGTVDWLYCIAGDPAPGCVSSVNIIDALDGNKVGPTDSGIQERWALGAQCDTNGNGKDDFGEVFVPNPGGDPTYNVNCPDSPWLVIIPIVSYESTPVKKVTIRGWSLAYLESYACVGGNNCGSAKGHWEVAVQIVDAAYSQAAGFLGAYDPNSGILLRRLVE
jgi:hypothetical protein